MTLEFSESPSATQPRRLDHRRTARAIALLIGLDAATAVTGVGTAGTAVAALISSPLTATKGPALGALTRVARCTFVDDDTTPSLFDFPLQVAIGSSDFALYVGSGLFTTLVLVFLPQLAAGLFYLCCGSRGNSAVGTIGWGARLATIQRKGFANIAALVLSYFGPITFKLPFLILWHSRSPIDIAIAVLCPLLVLMII
jgi:hypothetical protein